MASVSSCLFCYNALGETGPVLTSNNTEICSARQVEKFLVDSGTEPPGAQICPASSGRWRKKRRSSPDVENDQRFFGEISTGYRASSESPYAGLERVPDYRRSSLEGSLTTTHSRRPGRPRRGSRRRILPRHRICTFSRLSVPAAGSTRTGAPSRTSIFSFSSN